jgi:hypothetical protein
MPSVSEVEEYNSRASRYDDQSAKSQIPLQKLVTFAVNNDHEDSFKEIVDDNSKHLEPSRNDES